MATITNSISTNNVSSVLQSNGGALNIATLSTQTPVQIGNSTGNTSVNITTGTLGHTIATTNGVFTATTGSGNINIGQSSTTGNISIGNSSGGALVMASSAASSIAVANNTFGVTTGTGTLSLGADATDHSIVIGSATGVNAMTLNVGSGSLNIPSFSSYGALVTTTAGVISDAASTSGYVLTGNSGSAPSFQALPVALTPFINVTGSTQAMAVNTGYVSNDTSTLVTFTLPATAAVGQRVAVQGAGSGLWRISQNASQTISFNAATTTSGTSGYILSTSQFDTIDLVCITTNNAWAVFTSTGNLSVN